MLKIKNHKLISIALALALSIFTLVNLCSCTDDENDNKPKPIYEISFMCNGEMQTERSSVTVLLDNISFCGTMYYDEAPKKYRYSYEEYQELTDLWCIINLTKHSNVIDLSENDIGHSIHFRTKNEGDRKGKIIGITYNYVYVEIINHQTLSITNWQGTTVYTVSSYKITYFDNIK